MSVKLLLVMLQPCEYVPLASAELPVDVTFPPTKRVHAVTRFGVSDQEAERMNFEPLGVTVTVGPTRAGAAGMAMSSSLLYALSVGSMAVTT